MTKIFNATYSNTCVLFVVAKYITFYDLPPLSDEVHTLYSGFTENYMAGRFYLRIWELKIQNACVVALTVNFL